MKKNHHNREIAMRHIARGGNFPSTAVIASHFDAPTEAERIYAELYAPKPKREVLPITIRKFSWEEN